MTDKALKAAIEQAGGWSALARALGIKMQSIQNWRRIPAERVISIEKITGIPRERLRPDIYPPKERENCALLEKSNSAQ